MALAQQRLRHGAANETARACHQNTHACSLLCRTSLAAPARPRLPLLRIESPAHARGLIRLDWVS
jgi:hypothetical protein